MNEAFEKVYEWTNEKLQKERERVDEYKKDVRQSEALVIGIIIVCLIISFIAGDQTSKYVFVTVAAMMFIFCTFYTFKHERKIIEKQNKYSEFALSELAIHIEDGFVYEKDEELSGSYYRKSGFNRMYKKFESKGVISGTKANHDISLSNIVVKGSNKELFRGIFMYGTLKKEIKEIDVMRVNSKNNKKEKFEIPNQGLYMYAESISEAREIINDEVLEYIAKFQEETKYKYEYMLHKNMVFFRFFDNEILTKPITNDTETKEYLYKYYRIIEFMTGLLTLLEK